VYLGIEFLYASLSGRIVQEREYLTWRRTLALWPREQGCYPC